MGCFRVASLSWFPSSRDLGPSAAAVRMLGLDEGVARELRPLASAVFAAAAEPFDAELRRQASDATVELGSVVGAPDVQAFVALTETLPAFIVNAYLALLQSGASIERVTPAAVEELLRYAGPAVAQLRTGATGERIALMIASANRDPEQFPEPNALRLDRRCNQHLAFGFGTHSCVGSAIIRALSKIALNALLERFKGPILLDCAPRAAFAIRSLASLHIKSQP